MMMMNQTDMLLREEEVGVVRANAIIGRLEEKLVAAPSWYHINA